MHFEVGIRGLEALANLPKKTAAKLDEAERRTVRILQSLGMRRLRVLLKGEDRKSRTGQLGRSIAATEPERLAGSAGWSGRFGYGSGSSARYAPMMEYGGTIVPKTAKVLAVPVGAALTATGRARFSSPRQVEGGFWVSRGGGLPPIFAVERGGKNSRRLDVLFVGLKRVTIKGAGSATKARNEAQSRARFVLDEQIRLALAPGTG